MPYPLHVTVPTVSLPNMHTEFDASSFTSSFWTPRHSSPPLGLQRPTTAMSSVSSISIRIRTSRRGLGKVFAGIKKMFGASSRAKSIRVTKQPLRHSGGVGYVMPGERKNMMPSERRELNKIPGRGVVGDGGPPVRSRRHCSTLRRARTAKVVSRYLSDELCLPDVVVSTPSLSRRTIVQRSLSFSKGDDAGYLGVYSKLRVTNPDDAASVCSNVTGAPVDDQDVAMSGGLGDVNEIPESYEAFKARLHVREHRTDDGPPRLQFIPRLAPLDFDPDMALMPAPLSPSLGPDIIQRNRDDTLRQLESGAREDHPAVLKPQPHPASLLPGPRYRDHEGVERVRPTTYCQPRDVYSPDDFGNFSKLSRYYARHTLSPAWQGGREVRDVSKIGRPRSPTPELFASGEQHKQFHDRVESGVFDAPLMPIERPSNPSPPSTLSSNGAANRSSGNSIDRTFLESPTPPSSRPVSNDAARASGPVGVTKSTGIRKSAPATTIARKPVPSSPAPVARKPVASTPAPVTNKPLPATPALVRPRQSPRSTSSGVPTAHKMNNNGYPVSDLRAAEASYSATPSYQRRTVDEVEAKYRKTTAEQKKANKAAEKEAKKAAKEQKRKHKYEQRPDLVRKQREMQSAVRRLLGV